MTAPSTIWPDLSSGRFHNHLDQSPNTREAAVSPLRECTLLEPKTGNRPGFAAVAGALGSDLGAASRDSIGAATDLLIANRCRNERNGR